jgi:membrane protease subunit (stomatin/prohibitin family)
MRVENPVAFVKEIVGTDGTFTKEEITEQLRNIIVARFSDLVAESKIAALDLASNYDELGKFASERLHDDFEAYGLDVTNLMVENVSLPPEVEAALDKRTSMGVIGNLQQYAQFQAANAMESAAKNPGGEAAGGMGLGMGFAMANQMVNSFAQQTPQGAPAGPPPIPGQTSYFVAVNGQQTGPFAPALLQQQAQQGALTAETLVWTQGMASWVAAGQVPELAGIFQQGPPPLPE